MQRSVIAAVASVIALALAGRAYAGRIVLTNDEWTLSDTGFSAAPTSTTDFVENVAAWFGGTGGGTFHAYSMNFSMNQSALGAAMGNAGHIYTTGFAPTFNLPTLLTYDGIFLAGQGGALDTSVLIDYVNAGGNVYLAGGTGDFGGAAGEAAFWNPLLNAFGLGFGPAYNGIIGVIPISSAHPIFNGPGGVVTGLYENNGNDSLDINVADARGQVLISLGGRDLYAVFDSAVIPVPEPSIFLLLGGGLLGLELWRTSRHRSRIR